MRTQSDGSRSIASRLWPAYAELLRWRHRKDEGRFYGLDLSPEILRDATIDWHDYEKFYAPQNGPEGARLWMSRVFHAGIGEGETVPFLLKEGAREIIGIDSDPSKIKRLERNINKFGWPVKVYCKEFNYTHPYLWDTDFAIIDVEGAEERLLELSKIEFPCAIEIHGRELYQKFRTKFPNLRYDRVRWPSELWMARFP